MVIKKLFHHFLNYYFYYCLYNFKVEKINEISNYSISPTSH